MQRKIAAISFLIVIVFCCTSFRFALATKTAPAITDNLQQQQQNKLRTIVIDAGHGGKDIGARGKYSYEKNVALAIALKLQATLQQALPDVKIVMTRTTDIFDDPRVKANKANAAKGDLFICIHCNSAKPITHSEITGYKTQTYYTGKGKKRKKHTRKVAVRRYWTTPNPAKGTETYIWAADRNDNKEVAMMENESLYMDSSLAQQLGDFDPGDPTRKMYYTLKTQQYFQRSANLARDVENEFIKIGRTSREARQRGVGIWVLQATAMPSILVETGFISNPEDEDYLNSTSGQQELCNAITNAVMNYKNNLETNSFQSFSQDSLQ
ncbi:N-acetylmuramoyl-L-alanine amidase family protein [Parafilimonas terrae]|uniref:N-acetylmuramoyl-L-alanine amidase n=1 Tax=Parafilimonas terrae TaxID=1465490 RepID=A0A1I5URA6_9BACT|nr:N-acetylmuramoyl-L-alanine amidase [Parafilimonas terrae]SFP97834.1 N-acetylmuramoyl-L-alanine amidase [Parafilimonas terrae]